MSFSSSQVGWGRAAGGRRLLRTRTHAFRPSVCWAAVTECLSNHGGGGNRRPAERPAAATIPRSRYLFKRHTRSLPCVTEYRFPSTSSPARCLLRWGGSASARTAGPGARMGSEETGSPVPVCQWMYVSVMLPPPPTTQGLEVHALPSACPPFLLRLRPPLTSKVSQRAALF